MRTVVGVFPSRAAAGHVAQDLKALGIANDDLKIATPVTTEQGQRATKYSRASAVRRGAIIGGGLGIIAGFIALMLHGGVPIIIGDQAGTVITGLGIGAIGGAALAWFYRSGVSHESIPLAQEAARENGVAVAAHVDNFTEAEALRVMKEHGASKLRSGLDAWAASGSTADHRDEALYPSDSEVRSEPYRDY